MILNIFGEIGWDVVATDVIQQIQSNQDDKIKVVIASGGGSAFEGLMIYDALKASGKEIETVILGLGASAASVIFMAGDKREMGEGALLMVHNSWSYFVGNAEEIREQLGTLEAIDSRMTSIFMNGTGLNEEKVRELLADETFMSASEALELGFSTGEAESLSIAASVHNLYKREKEPVNMAEENKEDSSLLDKIKALFKSEEAPKAETAERQPEAEEIEAPEQPEEVEQPEASAEDAPKAEAPEEAPETGEQPEEVAELKAKIENLESKVTALTDESENKASVILNGLKESKISMYEANSLAEKSLSEVQDFVSNREPNATGLGKPEGEPENNPESNIDHKAVWKNLIKEDPQKAQNYYQKHRNEINNKES